MHWVRSEMFSIETGMWCEAPSLRKPRQLHSSTSFGEMIYVFCGVDGSSGRKNYLTSIEYLSAREHVFGIGCQLWRLIELGKENLTPRCNPLVAPFNDTQILIAGGLDQKNEKLRDRILYDIKDSTFKSLPSSGAFEAESN